MEKESSLENIPKSLKLARQLENSTDLEFIKTHLGELLDLIHQDTGSNLLEDVEKIYREMKETGCLVRVEQLSRILETIELGTKLEIGHQGETHYANAVIPEDEGIRLALAEGQAPGPFRTMVSFGKTIVGFKTDHLEVAEVDFLDSNTSLRDENLRRYVCRHVVGNIEKEDIKYIVIRIPKNLLDEKHLTEEEKTEPDMTFVFRATHF